jgi:small subunit ribosomal protein S17
MTPETRKRPRMIEGVVVSDKMDKTRVVEIRRNVRHGLYTKRLIKRSRFFVHDEQNKSKTGDTIQAVATRPLSKHKSFRLLKIMEKRATV